MTDFHPRDRSGSAKALLVLTWVAVLVAGLSLITGRAHAAGTVRTEATHVPSGPAHPAAEAARHRTSLAFHAMASPGPLASIASINPVVHPFKFFLLFHPLTSDSLALKGFEIKPFFPHQAAPLGGCVHCTGHGTFPSLKLKGHTLTETVKGLRILSVKTRFPQAIVRRGEIGRFKEFGIKLNPVRPFVRAEGCLGADTGLTNEDLLSGGALPLVPCTAANPTDATTHVNTPVELSKTVQQHATVTGNAKGSRWLSVFKVHAACGANAQATSHIRGQSHALWHVHGRFSEGFTTGLDTRAGNFCAYLQTGGRWKGIPDGRISQKGVFPFLAGDSVAITGASTAVAGQSVNDTFSGFASTKEYLWTFDAPTPCAATAQAEYAPSVGVGANPVSGLFSIPINSVPLTQSAYRCAYLQLGAPKNNKPTGLTLATASVLITVS
jgi:hypothetical protein